MGLIADWLSTQDVWLIILAINLFFSILTMVFYYTRDKYEPETIWAIVRAWGYGGLAIIPALVFSLVAYRVLPFNLIIFSILIGPIIEEFAKGWMVISLSKSDNFDGPLDGLIYGGMVGAGFSFFENMLYGYNAAWTQGYEFGIELSFYRSIPQIIGHPLYTGIMGVGVGLFKVGLRSNKYNKIRRSILLHAGWNFAASQGSVGAMLGGLAILAIISIYILREELMKALNLDREAFESGYYDKKKIYHAEVERRRLMFRQKSWDQNRGPQKDQFNQTNQDGFSPVEELDGFQRTNPEDEFSNKD